MTPYRRIGHRISLLPVARHCGLAPKLSEQHGSDRSALIGSAGHAAMAGSPNARELLLRLEPKEREEVADWERPSTITIDEGGESVTLAYEDAEKEVPVGLDTLGFAVNPETEETLTSGTLDFAWVRHVGGERVAYVADIKRTAWATADGAETLQVLTYGYAFALARGCSAFVPGLWYATDPVLGGHYDWGKWYSVARDGEEIWQRIEQAALNRDERPQRGPHCYTHCWARLHCPEYVLPAAAAGTILDPVTKLGVPVDSADVLKLLEFLDLYDDVSEAARKQIKALVKRGAVDLRRAGKKYRAVECRGKQSLDAEAVKRDFGDKYLKRGAPYDMLRWVKE